MPCLEPQSSLLAAFSDDGREVTFMTLQEDAISKQQVLLGWIGWED
jgi:hypothetical protein